jgi:lycopene beta-cyclase
VRRKKPNSARSSARSESALWIGWSRSRPRTHEEGAEIDHLQYLALLGACLLITLPLEFVLGARVYRRPLALVLAVLPVVMIFSIWDLIGIYRQHWSYNVRFVTGIELPPALPLEELGFFVVIPICGLLTYEAVGTMLNRNRRRKAARQVNNA